MKLTINEMCTIHRALGIIEGTTDHLKGDANTLLCTAVEMIDGLLDKCEVATR